LFWPTVQQNTISFSDQVDVESFNEPQHLKAAIAYFHTRTPPFYISLDTKIIPFTWQSKRAFH